MYCTTRRGAFMKPGTKIPAFSHRSLLISCNRLTLNAPFGGVRGEHALPYFVAGGGGQGASSRSRGGGTPRRPLARSALAPKEYACALIWPEDRMTGTGFKSKYSPAQPVELKRSGSLSRRTARSPAVPGGAAPPGITCGLALHSWRRVADVHFA